MFKLSQYCENPTIGDWCNVKHVLKYLRGTIDYKLRYEKKGGQIEVFVDADFNANPEDSISISGYVVTLAGEAISWRSHKQSNVSTSTVHSEYMALYDVCTEVT